MTSARLHPAHLRVEILRLRMVHNQRIGRLFRHQHEILRSVARRSHPPADNSHNLRAIFQIRASRIPKAISAPSISLMKQLLDACRRPRSRSPVPASSACANIPPSLPPIPRRIHADKDNPDTDPACATPPPPASPHPPTVTSCTPSTSNSPDSCDRKKSEMQSRRRPVCRGNANRSRSSRAPLRRRFPRLKFLRRDKRSDRPPPIAPENIRTPPSAESTSPQSPRFSRLSNTGSAFSSINFRYSSRFDPFCLNPHCPVNSAVLLINGKTSRGEISFTATPPQNGGAGTGLSRATETRPSRHPR